jgi:hypothetical protein
MFQEGESAVGSDAYISPALPGWPGRTLDDIPLQTLNDHRQAGLRSNPEFQTATLNCNGTQYTLKVECTCKPKEEEEKQAIGTQKVYAGVSTLLFGLATFAGALTLATQFIITCPESRLQVLLGIASQLFLGSLLGNVVVFFLMYGFREEDPLPKNVHMTVLMQFTIVGMMKYRCFRSAECLDNGGW